MLRHGEVGVSKFLRRHDPDQVRGVCSQPVSSRAPPMETHLRSNAKELLRVWEPGNAMSTAQRGGVDTRCTHPPLHPDAKCTRQRGYPYAGWPTARLRVGTESVGWGVSALDPASCIRVGGRADVSRVRRASSPVGRSKPRGFEGARSHTSRGRGAATSRGRTRA